MILFARSRIPVMEIVVAFPFLSSSWSFILGCFGSDDWARLATCAALKRPEGCKFPQGLKPSLDTSLAARLKSCPDAM
jgi:hypothetical protein